MLAERKLRLGRVEEAVTDWHKVLEDYPHVQSGRCDDRVRTMVSVLAPHRRNHLAGEIYDRGRALLRT
ncbi:hypothetical protein ACFXJO_12860 [Streptomyces lavendulae]|uniref:hypothetical protein n=1 Tax=Streptomyces lavendulae TaxID=1914 RepID=UPI0036B8FB28